MYAHASNELILKASYELSTSRAGGKRHEIEIGDKEMVEFIFDDKTSWFGNSDTLHELFPEIDLKRSLTDVIDLPFALKDDNESRSLASVALKVLNIFEKKQTKENVKELAQQLEVKLLDGQSGLYTISPSFELKELKTFKADKPYLLFLHGTGSSTLGSFGELSGSSLWADMQRIYEGNILGFQHETLTKSPLRNALELITQLPNEITLHVISHSRGGIVGDVLARFCSNENGFNETGIALLERLKEQEDPSTTTTQNNRSEDVKNIKEISKIIASKKITIEKFIRVACPARGTSLLSNRLDTFFNVLINLMSFIPGTNSNIITEGLKNLITAAIDNKSDVSVLPGLEAMNPSSPFLKLLNAPDPIKGMVFVISGNSSFSLQLKGLIVIISKLVFKGENDFVVNTQSMYQGAVREKGLYYFYDKGAEVNHFNYFKNIDTRKAILSILSVKDTIPENFVEYKRLGLEEMKRGVFGLEGGTVSYTNATGTRPIVILLPGIMGSNLNLKKGTKVWINYLRLVSGGLSELHETDLSKTNVEANSLIKTSYKNLCEFLSKDYDIITFPYDWRLSVEEAAKGLNTKIVDLLKKGQPIKIIAHSMGGVLAREFIFNHEATWKELNNSKGFKLLLLGTPWKGSYRIPNVFAGRDSIIKQLNSLDLAHSLEELINMFIDFPGILNLLPVTEERNFADIKVWEELRNASKLKWKLPSKKLLDDFGKFRQKVLDHEATFSKENKDDKNDDKKYPKMYDNIMYIAGKDDSTPNGYEISNDVLKFNVTGKGDQSVTWELGIPSQLRGKKSLYYSEVTHGALACKESLFPAILQLISLGSTELLSRSEPIVKENKSRALIEAEVDEVFESSEESTLHNILGIPLKEDEEKDSLPKVKVSVSHGDLMFSSYPILIGHFKGDGIVSAERVADSYLKKGLTIKHELGNYPGEIGTYQFVLTQDQDFKGACIIGLGEFDKLSSLGLVMSVEKAMTQYILEYCKKDTYKRKPTNGISVLLIGTDYGGLSIESSIRSIILGIQKSNSKLNDIKKEAEKSNSNDIKRLVDVNLIEQIEFVELFEDRALQCFYSLKKIMNSASEEVQIEFGNTKIKNLLGKRKRLFVDSKSDWWQRLTVQTDPESASSSMKKLNFLSSTNGAREEKKELQSNTKLIESLLESISTNERWTADAAKTIFELLIPNDFKENIKRQTDILWVLDDYSASYPWELFQSDIENKDSKPLCINAGMIRQLATSEYKPNPSAVNNNNVLIIGDPLTHGFCNQLPGAEKEAKEVKALFNQFDNYIVEDVINKEAGDIVTSLFKKDYKIIHISAHGNFDKQDEEKSGLIIGDNVFLRPREFNQLSYTPELVFVNCCFLGKVDGDQENLYTGRYKLAANIGTQLIRNGVKVVIAAGWAVDDAAALLFANIFYEKMFDGYEFGKAVLLARQAVYDKHKDTNTWGAFQCYGDPFYKLKLSSKRAPKPKNYIVTQEAENDIDNLLSKAEISYFDTSELMDDLEKIDKAITEFKVATPDLLEKVALAYVEFNDYRKAIDLFGQVIQAEKASFTVKTLEKYNNILAKQILKEFLEEKKVKDDEKKKEVDAKQVDKKTVKNKTAKSKVAIVEEKPDANKRKYNEEIDKVILSLRKLLDIANTSERFSLIGSAYKRKAAICEKAEDKKDALKHAAYYYFRANELKKNDMYSLSNWIEIEFFLNELGINKWGHEIKINLETEQGKNTEVSYQLPSIEDFNSKLEKGIDDVENKVKFECVGFWDQIAKANAALCKWLLDHGKADKDGANSVFQEYKRVWEKVGSKNKKTSEIEHFELLSNFGELLLSEKEPKNKALKESLSKLKEDLEKEIK